MLSRLHGRELFRVALTVGAAAASRLLCPCLCLFLRGGAYRNWLVRPLVWVGAFGLGAGAGVVVGLWLEYESSRALRKDLDEILYGVRILSEEICITAGNSGEYEQQTRFGSSLTVWRPSGRSRPVISSDWPMRESSWSIRQKRLECWRKGSVWPGNSTMRSVSSFLPWQ